MGTLQGESPSSLPDKWRLRRHKTGYIAWRTQKKSGRNGYSQSFKNPGKAVGKKYIPVHIAFSRLDRERLACELALRALWRTGGKRRERFWVRVRVSFSRSVARALRRACSQAREWWIRKPSSSFCTPHPFFLSFSFSGNTRRKTIKKQHDQRIIWIPHLYLLSHKWMIIIK